MDPALKVMLFGIGMLIVYIGFDIVFRKVIMSRFRRKTEALKAKAAQDSARAPQPLPSPEAAPDPRP
jgi:hypothetical protein